MACLHWIRCGLTLTQQNIFPRYSLTWHRVHLAGHCLSYLSQDSPNRAFGSFSRIQSLRTIIPASMSCLSSAAAASSSTSRTTGHMDRNGASSGESDMMRQDDVTIKHAKQIFNEAVASVHPHEMIRRNIHFDKSSDILTVAQHSYHLQCNVHVVGFGKAVLGMARAVEDTIGQHIVQGVISVPVGATSALKESGKLDMIPGPDSKIKVREGAANNLPDEEAYKAAMEIKDIAETLGQDDILLVLISGGGSALLPMPYDSISLRDIMHVSQEMAKAGADIKQLNYMRKQIEVLKGGGLASLAFPARVLALILSDVIGDPLDFIASGPTLPDSSTPDGCLAIFSQLGMDGRVPKSVIDFLHQKQDLNLHEDAVDENILMKVQNVVIGSNALACQTATTVSESLGYQPYIYSTELSGEARAIGTAFAVLAFYISASLNPSLYDTESVKFELMTNFYFESKQINEITSLIAICKEKKKDLAIIAGGETTVTVRGRGKGGRNQEMALAAALELNKRFSDFLMQRNLHTNEVKMCEKDVIHMQRPVSVVFLSGGTDGQDGPTPAAGGIVTLDFVRHSEQIGLNAHQYLDENDSYNLFKLVNESRYLLDTGLTGTNVMDINLILIRNIVLNE